MRVWDCASCYDVRTSPIKALYSRLVLCGTVFTLSRGAPLVDGEDNAATQNQNVILKPPGVAGARTAAVRACHAPSAHPSHPPGPGALRRSSSALSPRQRHRHLATLRQWFRRLVSRWHLPKRRRWPQVATRRSWHDLSRHRDSCDPMPCRRSQRPSPVPKQVIRAVV